MLLTDCLEPVVQTGFKPGKGSGVDCECVLKVEEKGGVVDGVKGSWHCSSPLNHWLALQQSTESLAGTAAVH